MAVTNGSSGLWGAIAKFVGVLFVVSLLVQILGRLVPAEWIVVVFAVIALAWALVFPNRFAPLDSDRVDLWYYTLGGIGVVLFFFASAADRDRLAVARDYTLASGRLDRFLTLRPEIERVVGRPSELFEAIRSVGGSEDAAERRLELFRQCQELSELEMKLELERQMLERLRRSQSPFPDSSGRLLTSTDLPLPPRDCSAIVLSGLELQRLRNAESPRDLIAMVQGMDLRSIEAQLDLDLAPLRLEDVLAYLDRAWDTNDVVSVLDSDETALRTSLTELETARQEEVTGAMPGVSEWIREFYWPYVVLTAFGLKIARRKYV